MEKVTARIFRFDPDVDEAPRYETYEVPYEKHMRVLDVLIAIGDDLGKGIGHRWYCGVKRCGACSAMVNGLPVAVCWEAAQENMVIDPLPNFPIVRDLVVDRTGYDRVVSSFRRYLGRKEKPSKFPEDLRHEDMLKVWYSIQCVECLCCTAVCPVSEIGYKPWVGPMGHVQLAKYALDPRDSLDRTDELLAAGATALSGSISEPAWKTKPSWYLVATDDKMIPPPAQRFMAKRAGSTVVEAAGSHAIYVSQPNAVAAIIEKAGSGVKTGAN